MVLHYKKPWGEDKEVMDEAEYRDTPRYTPQHRGTLLPVFSEHICICRLISSSVRTNALTSELGLCLKLDNQPAILTDVDPDYLQPS